MRPVPIGGVVLARPFVRTRVTLLVAVPLAALLGLAALGVLAVLVAAVIAFAQSDAASPVLDAIDWSPRRRRRHDD
jgi:hypothetical protein